MANMWWRGALGVTDWGLFRWSNTEGGLMTGTIPLATDDAKFSNTASLYICRLQANREALSIATNTVDTGGTDNWINTLNLGVYNLIVGTFVRFNGTDASNKSILKLTSSADQGLVCDELKMGLYSQIQLAVDSKFTIKSKFEFANSAIINNNNYGIITFADNGGTHIVTIDKIYNFTFFSQIIINAGVTIQSVQANAYLTDHLSLSNTINGIINTNGKTTHMGCIGSGGSFTFGVNSDVTGAGALRLSIEDGATYTNNRATAFTYGFWQVANTAGFVFLIPAVDSPNSWMTVFAGASAITRKFTAGTLKVDTFQIGTSAAGQVTINNTNNANIELTGSLVLTNTGGTVWQKGTTEQITFKGSGSHNLLANSFGRIIVNGTIQHFSDAFTTTGLDVQAGVCTFMTAIVSSGDLLFGNYANIFLLGLRQFTLTGTGNLSNPHSSNILDLLLATAGTHTLTNDFYTKQIIFINSALTGAYVLYIVNPAVNDFLVLTASTCDVTAIDISLNANRSISGFTADSDLYVNGGNKLTLNTAMIINNINVLASTTLQADGNITGINIDNKGTLAIGTNNATISGDITTDAAASYTGTGTITLTGSSGTQTIDFADKIINILELNSVGALKELKGDIKLNKITGNGTIKADSLGSVYTLKAAA